MGQVEKAIIEILDELRSFEKKHGKRPLAQAPVKTKGKQSKATSTPKKKSTPVSTKEQLSKDQKAQAPANSFSDSSRTSSNSQPNSQPEVLGQCPFCGGDVIEGKKGYGCLNWRKGCTFVVWKTPICGKVLSPTQLKKLLKKGSTDLIKGFQSKTGKAFSAHLVWAEEGSAKLKFVFEQEQNMN